MSNEYVDQEHPILHEEHDFYGVLPYVIILVILLSGEDDLPLTVLRGVLIIYGWP